jgi:CNT family concentrative nucleoside transporter
MAKILFPQTEAIEKNTNVSKQDVGSNPLDAIANGTLEGVKLAANIGGMLLVFVALIAMGNGILFQIGEFTTLNDWIADWSTYDALSIEAVLGTLFAPLMWLIGVPWNDLMPMGQLLGVKLAASEFVGYIQLAELKNSANDLHFMYQKSIVMATYMLCGFANFASIGIQIGGIGGLAPNQRKVLSKFGFRAVLGGTLASLLSATLVGVLLG